MQMGVLPNNICQLVEKCVEGCLVTRNPDWIVRCEDDMFTCEGMANPHRACVWGGVQFGGILFFEKNHFLYCEFMLKLCYRRGVTRLCYHHHNYHNHHNNSSYYNIAFQTGVWFWKGSAGHFLFCVPTDHVC